jgi:hypothetical protein
MPPPAKSGSWTWRRARQLWRCSQTRSLWPRFSLRLAQLHEATSPVGQIGNRAKQSAHQLSQLRFVIHFPQ